VNRQAWATAFRNASEIGIGPKPTADLVMPTSSTICPALTVVPLRRILDSGSGNHLVGANLLTKKELASAKPIEQDILLSTGNGIVKPELTVGLYVDALGARSTSFSRSHLLC
jgi:hypothetical protein